MTQPTRFLLLGLVASSSSSVQALAPPVTTTSPLTISTGTASWSSPAQKIQTARKASSGNGNDENDVASSIMGRRNAFRSIILGGAAFVTASTLSGVEPSLALDIDSFMSSELSKDTNNCDPKRDPKCIPKLSSDEALCKYGQSGDARQEACRKVKAAGKEVPKAGGAGKSLGGAYAM